MSVSVVSSGWLVDVLVVIIREMVGESTYECMSGDRFMEAKEKSYCY